MAETYPDRFGERLRGYLRLIIAPEVLIPLMTLSVGLGIGGSLRHPRYHVYLTPVLGWIIPVIHLALIGAAMGGRAFREILSPRHLSWPELGVIIVTGIGLPLGVLAYFRAWEPLAVWVLGSGLLFYWHWLSLRAGPQVDILREMVGAFLLAPLPLFFSWTVAARDFFPDPEIGLAMLIFWLSALGANLYRAWSGTGRREPPGGSLFGRAIVITAIFIFSFLIVFLGIHEKVFSPPRMSYLKYGGLAAYVSGLIFHYVGLRKIMTDTGESNFIGYVLYGLLPVLLLVFWLAYQGRSIGF